MSENDNKFDFGVGSQGTAEKAKDPKKTIKKLLVYLAPHKVTLIAVLIFALVSTAFAVLGPRIMGRVTTILVDGILAHWLGTGLLTDFRQMGTLTLVLIGLYIISAACNLVQEIIMAQLSVKVTYKLRSEISEKMHRLPINYYDTRSQGEIMSRITNDVDMISQTLSTNLTQLVTSATTIIGTLVMMLSISWLMTASALVIIPLSMWIMMLVMNKSYIYFSKQQEELGKLSGIVEETYSGHNIVVAYNGEVEVEEKFARASKEVYSAAWKAQFFTNIIEPIFYFVGNLGYVLVCVMGGVMVVQRQITIGDVQAFVQYIQTFTQPLSEIGLAGNMLQGTIAASERVFEFLEEDEEIAETDKSTQKENYEGRVSFQNVRFGYVPDKIILNDFSAEIAAGQTVAIVGPTGA